jgi:uncharacterized protein
MILDFMVSPKYKNKLIQIIRMYLPTCKIFLFGSRAKGTHTTGSDIDIAIDNITEISNKIMGKIKEEIEASTIPFFVDVVDIHAVTNEMKEQIKKYGVEWTV